MDRPRQLTNKSKEQPQSVAIKMNAPFSISICLLRGCALLAIVFAGNPCSADIIFSIDANPELAGIQTSRQIRSGETFDVHLLLALTGDSTLDSFRVSVNFDPAALTLMNALEYQPLGYRSDVPGFLTRPSGVLSPFEGARESFDTTSIIASTGRIAIGLITFTANSATDTTTIIAPFEDPLSDGSFDTNFDGVVSVLSGVSIHITPVPEPNCTLLLIGTCLLHLRKRRRKNLKRERIA